jgi:hypothetical protein
MRTMTRRTLWIAGLALAATAATAVAQQPARIAGTVKALNGPALVVTQAQGGDVTVTLADKLAVFAVAKATLADIKPGSFIGVGANPQADGSQDAILVTIFSEVQRGTGEGFRPWDRPGTTMTNATVETTVSGVKGQEVAVKYRGGEQKITVGKDATIRQYLQGDRSELKPGAKVAILGATKKPDGTLETARINVGRGDMVP